MAMFRIIYQKNKIERFSPSPRLSLINNLIKKRDYNKIRYTGVYWTLSGKIRVVGNNRPHYFRYN